MENLFGIQFETKPVVIIGGTDGSGTRAFVNLMKELGVRILADDTKTFDIHGQEMFHGEGWPTLVKTVLNVTHSANYQWEDLPKHTQDIVEAQVQLLLKSMHRKYIRHYPSASFSNNDNSNNNKYRNPRKRQTFSKEVNAPIDQSGVLFAVKAPVTMLLLPVLSHFFPNLKFLQVVRDGRDIALSDNQSPVLKFYNTTYVDYDARSQTYDGKLWNVRGIQLWNDWNLQAHSWSMSQLELSQSLSSSNSSPSSSSTLDSSHQNSTQTKKSTFDYLVVRSEDLVSSTQRRFEVYHRIATFVGSHYVKQINRQSKNTSSVLPLSLSSSSQSIKTLCCLSRKKSKDFGASAKVDKETAVHDKYGYHARSSYSLEEAKEMLSWLTHKKHKEEESNGDDHSSNNQQADREMTLQQKQLYKQESELIKLNSTLAKEEKSLRGLDADLEQREKSLKELQASLMKLDASLEQELKKHQSLVNASHETTNQETSNVSNSSSLLGHHNETEKPISKRRRLQEHNFADDPAEFMDRYGHWRVMLKQVTNGKSNSDEWNDISYMSILDLVRLGNELQLDWNIRWSMQRHSHTELEQYKESEVNPYLESLKLLEKKKKDKASPEDLKYWETVKQQDYKIRSIERGEDVGEGVQLLLSQNQSREKKKKEKNQLRLDQRYGKWQKILSNRPVLSEHLHREGAEGLRIFGYEPFQAVDYFSPEILAMFNSETSTQNQTDFAHHQCDESIKCDS